VNAYLLRVPHSLRGWQRVRGLKFSNFHLGSISRAGGQPFHVTDVKAYLLRVPHSLRGWQRVRVLKFSNFRLGSISGVHPLFSPY
jgi:hypothetical protein